MTAIRQTMRRVALIAVASWAVAGCLGATRAQASAPPRHIESAKPQARSGLEKEALRRDLLQKLGSMRQQVLRDYDWDHNGKIEGNEREAMRKARKIQHERSEKRALTHFDANRDGKLDAREQEVRRAARSAWLSRIREQARVQFDANHNGVLDPEERAVIRATAEKTRLSALEKYDTNRDGRLSDQERLAVSDRGAKHSSARAVLAKDVAAAQGGTVQVADGRATVTIPAGALSADALVTLMADSPSERTSEPGLRLLDSWTLTVEGATLISPATLDLSYASRGDSVPEPTLAVGRWTGERWLKVGGTVSSGTKRVSIEVTSAGRYGLLEFASLPGGPALIADLRLSSAGGFRFEGGVDIAFTLASPGEVSVKVFDVSGRLVRMLGSHELLGGGKHSMHWDGRSSYGRQVASGLYLIRLEGPANQVTGKVVLVH